MTANDHLPQIGSLQLCEGEGGAGTKGGGAGDRKRSSKAVSFLSRLQLGSLQVAPQPGDTYRGAVSSRRARPLGLLPGHNDRLLALRKLNQLLSPWMLGQRAPPPPAPPPSAPGHQTNPTWPPANVTEVTDTISATVQLKPVDPDKTEHKVPVSDGDTAYRLPVKGYTGDYSGNKKDPDYMGDKAREYYAMIGNVPLPTPRVITQQTQLNPTNNQKGEKKKAKLKRYDHTPVTNVHYMNFTEQAQLFERSLTDDKRTALGYEPCERCRLRGTRCSQCKAIRTGGGYIILDAGADPTSLLNRRRKGYDFKWQGHGAGGGGGGGRGGGMKGEGWTGVETDGRGGYGGGEGGEEGGGGRVSGDGGDRWTGGEGGRGGWGVDRGGGSGVGEGVDGAGGQKDASRDGTWRAGTQPQKGDMESDAQGGGAGGGDGGRKVSGSTGRQSSLGGDGGTGLEDSGLDRGGAGDLSDVWEGSGRQGHTSRSGSRAGRASRPGSTLGARPGSSLRSSSRGDWGRRNRGYTDADPSQRHGKRPRGRGGGEEGEEEEEGGRRRGRKSSAVDGERRSREYQGSEFMYRRGDEEDEDRPGYRGNLMKFKRKKDDVKAKHATLRELQGIDPLDYLARYCIIDQTKLPHYQHVFNNVDRDEDDEIDIGELDFALKAVNYDLISDAEMNYVHSVLELAGRYNLNFKLFSLIAALSEKVVALEDMVKRLINKMDFDALEVKMKKCKELFYLLADSDALSEHEGGVVTTGSLAVELQAGGLTQEHVEFVVDRLNHEGKGLVEFLDYLTYVPLFVEIHDAISGNPLDFSRTK